MSLNPFGVRVVGIGGEPASGKTTLMKNVIGEWSDGRAVKVGLVEAIQYKRERVIVIGDYEPGRFAGTDRLSMGVMPDAKKFLRLVCANRVFEGYTLLFEGDRLFCGAWMEFVEGVVGKERAHWIVLVADRAAIAERHANRRDTQTMTFLKGRRTKYERLAALYEVRTLRNDNAEDLERNILVLKELLSLGKDLVKQ